MRKPPTKTTTAPTADKFIVYAMKKGKKRRKVMTLDGHIEDTKHVFDDYAVAHPGKYYLVRAVDDVLMAAIQTDGKLAFKEVRPNG